MAQQSWQVVAGPPLGAEAQMGLDEALLAEVAAGRRGPTLRFWEWTERALVVGSHQALRNEVDLEAARREGFRPVRRMSGGGTMVVEPEGVITWSLYAPEALVAGLSFVESFELLDRFAVAALRELGVDASYHPVNDILDRSGGKIAGAAQARRRGAVLHHTTMAYRLDPALVPRLIRIGRPRLVERGVRSAEKRVAPLACLLDPAPDRASVVDRLRRSFAAGHEVEEGRLAPAELERAQRLALEKYGTPAWLERL
jgi:lipoate---protein ligase